MNRIYLLFTKHPHDVGESYWAHQRYAIWTALRLAHVGWMLCVHSIFPFLYTSTASKGLIRLSNEIIDRAQGDKRHD